MAPTTYPEYDGNEWERRVKNWLRLRYPGGQFEEVPAEYLGDFGIEGFSRDGIAYQCYAPRGALKVKELYENQRIKITTDIGKFIERKAELTKLFGPLKIKSWWLVVPEHRSSKLVQHATSKAQEVTDANLPYVAPDFSIHIAVPADFAAEREAAIHKGIEALKLEEIEVTSLKIQEWADSNDEFVNKLDRKIKAYSRESRPERIRDIREKWIACFILAENMLKKLQLTYPGPWEELCAVKRRKENRLFLKYSGTRAGNDVLGEIIKELCSDILQRVPNLDPKHADDIAVGTVSEWLHRCPLNFPDEL